MVPYTLKSVQILTVGSCYGHIRQQYSDRWISCIPCGYEIFKMAAGGHIGFWYLQNSGVFLEYINV